MSDDDRSSNVSWPEYTEEDLQEIDRLCEECRRDSNRPVHGEESSSSVRSPFSEYRQRQRGYLTVTDLVAPAWCEVQFDYGLRQLRNKPLSERPKSFVTPKGKEIRVEANVAAKNADILDKGNTVHKKLEREIHKEDVPIKVRKKEEFWALNLLDFLVRLKTIKDTSVVRELPIWGIIQDHPVYGKIDELRLEALNVTDNSKSSSKDHQTQTRLDSFLTNGKEASQAHPKCPSHLIHIIDNKTRKNTSVPSHADSFSSRLQLMLYWLMLTRALTTSDEGTSFSTFCSRIGLRLVRDFSEKFMTEVARLVVENGLSLHFLDAKCLMDMDFPYRETIKDMGLDAEGCVNKRLSVVYRLRGFPAKKLRSSPSTTTDETTKLENSQGQAKNPAVVIEVEAEPSLVVDEGSIRLAPPMDGSEVTDITETNPSGTQYPSPKSVPETSNANGGGEGNTSTSRKRKRSSKSSAKTKPEVPDTSSDGSESSSESSADSSKGSSSFIVGTRKFQYDEGLLSAHLSSVLAWWHGKRPPHGVTIEDVGRCNSCEYKNGCEWREQKATEILEKAKTKSASINVERTS